MSLSRTTRQYRRQFYRDPSQFVFGMARGQQARAWPFDLLTSARVVNDEFLDEPVLIVFLPDSATALAYDRRVDGRTLSFTWRAGRLEDEETRTGWDPASGQALAGPLADRRLRRRIGTVSYRQAWDAFYPNSAYASAD